MADTTDMPLAARRVFRLSFTVALALACAYAMQLPLPFMAPMFAILLTATPEPPMGPKGLARLVLVVLTTLGVGLLLIPLLINYPLMGVLTVATGLYLSIYLTVNVGKALLGTLLTMGITLISATGSLSYPAAIGIIQALVLGICIAIICQWLVYPWFPEDPGGKAKPDAPPADAPQSTWIALRATLILLPTYLLVLTNPSAYAAIMMKSASLAQQGSTMEARRASRELLGSTFLAGCFAVLFWFALKLCPSLWMFFLWTLLFGVYFASKLYGLIPSRFPASFWVNVGVTMLLLLGPAVQDSADGKDVYAAFAVRMGLFVGVALYASLAIHALEWLRTNRLRRLSPSQPDMGSSRC